jgi:amino acid transporter
MGLIQGAYCLSPTGMLASMSEEVKKPEQTIPRAMLVPARPHQPCDGIS